MAIPAQTLAYARSSASRHGPPVGIRAKHHHHVSPHDQQYTADELLHRRRKATASGCHRVRHIASTTRQKKPCSRAPAAGVMAPVERRGYFPVQMR